MDNRLIFLYWFPTAKAERNVLRKSPSGDYRPRCY